MKIKSKNWKDISKVSYAPEEQEILFPRWTKLKLTSIDNEWMYVFEEL
jgi:hypothetical protein